MFFFFEVFGGVTSGMERGGGRGSYGVKEAEKDCWRGAKLDGAAAATAASARTRVESMVIEIELSLFSEGAEIWS